MTVTESQRDGSTSWAERAHRAAVDAEAKRSVYLAALELRDQLVIEGIDTGRTVRQVAEACHIAPSRVQQILARRG